MRISDLQRPLCALAGRKRPARHRPCADVHGLDRVAVRGPKTHTAGCAAPSAPCAQHRGVNLEAHRTGVAPQPGTWAAGAPTHGAGRHGLKAMPARSARCRPPRVLAASRSARAPYRTQSATATYNRTQNVGICIARLLTARSMRSQLRTPLWRLLAQLHR